VDSVVTRYIFDNEDILLELDGSNNITARYTHGPGIDEPLILEKSGVSSFYHADGLGSVTDLTDSLGTVVQSYTYSSFGEIESELDPTFVQPYTFTAREFNSETGLHFYRARAYDPSIGRFLQIDPIGLTGGINLYSYVANNPITLVDPFGFIGIKDLLKSPQIQAIGGAIFASLIKELSGKLCPGPARGLVNLVGSAIAIKTGVTAAKLSFGSAVAAFGTVPTGVGPVASTISTVAFGALTIQQSVVAFDFFQQAIEDFRSSGEDCDLVCPEADSK